jgi:histidinol phosphatase-like PHP family hydrolase
MLQDLHSHTFYSFCGGDEPEVVVEAAIAGGLDMIGITDHNYGIGYVNRALFKIASEVEAVDYEQALRRYYHHINLIREKYRDKICVLRGIEICTTYEENRRNLCLPKGTDISFFDYCLIENLDSPLSITNGDIFSYARRCGTPMVGIAHTDLFAHIKNLGADPYEYLRRMAEENIFWEMNVSYDSIHEYRVHEYMTRFFSDTAEGEMQRDLVRRAGTRISVGFDGHRIGDYLADRVAGYCRRLTAEGIRMPFED